ncbi:hypothetical protein C8J57DRAFT_1245165 [Mycena rebaudengoi]|nr:hypothetical protein C8J57DRAFT_1245165 [Mycena rebaudengoi]
MHVAGCIVFLALSLPVFAVPVLNGPNVGARTPKSTRTTHATLSTKLATAAQTVKTNSSAKVSMTPPKSSVKPSATSSPKPSAVIWFGSVRPIVSTSMKIAVNFESSDIAHILSVISSLTQIQQRHTDSQAFGLGANTHSCAPVDEVHFVFGPPEEFLGISELAWRGRYILGPTYELVHKNDYCGAFDSPDSIFAPLAYLVPAVPSVLTYLAFAFMLKPILLPKFTGPDQRFPQASK